MPRKKSAKIGELLIRSAGEAAAIQRGKLPPARETRYSITARSAAVQPPPRYDAPAVKQIRAGMDVSQRVFAQALNVSPDTVRAWEQGKREPDGASLRLLQVAERAPEVLLQSVRPHASGAVMRERRRGAS